MVVFAVLVTAIIYILPSFKPALWPHKQINLGLDLQIVVADQGRHAVKGGGGAQRAGLFAVVAPKAHHLEPDLFRGDAGGGDGMGAVAKDVDPLAGQVGRIDRGRIPRLAQGAVRST